MATIGNVPYFQTNPHVLLLTFSYWNMEDVDLDGRSNRKTVAHLGLGNHAVFFRMEYKALSNGM